MLVDPGDGSDASPGVFNSVLRWIPPVFNPNLGTAVLPNASDSLCFVLFCFFLIFLKDDRSMACSCLRARALLIFCDCVDAAVGAQRSFLTMLAHWMIDGGNLLTEIRVSHTTCIL